MAPPFPLSPVPSYFNTFDWATAGKKRNGVHYVGDAVTLYLTANTGYESGAHTASFEGGVNGATISTSDPGAANHWNTVGGTPVYDNTHTYDSMAAKFTGPSNYVGWTYTGAGVSEEYVRYYLYATANPSNQTNAYRSQQVFNGVRTDGKIGLDVFGGSIATTTAIALNQWVRIEFYVQYTTGSGNAELRLYNNPDSSTATEIVTGTLPATGPAGFNSLGWFGFTPTSTWGSSIWMDNIAAFGTSWWGPAAAADAVNTTRNYSVRDYFGNVVSSGSFTGLSFTPTVPSGGWDPGWYRVYLTGPQTDSVFGDSYGATNFCVIRSDSHFTTMPAATIAGTAGQGESPDFVMKGVMGLGTSRLLISDATNLSSGDTLAIATTEAAITANYWANNGIPDTVRPTRSPWLTFPNGGYTAGQQAGVTTTVAALYPLGVTRYEGPANEGTLNATLATRMQSFQAAVHAGNASAKAIGPSAVDISNLSGYRSFGDAGGFGYCDEISFHAYNFATNGDINLGRHTLDAFVAMLAEYGADTKPRWQTESTHAFTSVYGVYHPRRARVPILQILLMEQYAIPRERNSMWYDVSHGFWSYPAWLEMGDGSLNPQAVLGRVLAEETWGKPYASALDFGTPGNNMMLGNVYTNAAGASTVAIMSTSFIDNGSVLFDVTGSAGPVTVVDGFGNETVTSLSNGRQLLVSLTDVPTYIRLDEGVSVTPVACNGWAVASESHATASSAFLNATSAPAVADDAYYTNYGAGTGITFSAHPTTLPATAHAIYPTLQTVNRVVVTTGQAWQRSSVLVDFDIQTTQDGTTWSTATTVTKTTPSSFAFGTNSTNAGCSRETFWDEQWVFDITIPATQTLGIRVYARSTSYGGEPDAAAVAAGGQGWGPPPLAIQEIGAYSGTAVEPASDSSVLYAVAVIGGRPTFIQVRPN